jgi:branched-chain amino acid aminotransferase
LLESTWIWMNGELVPWKEAKVPFLTHALHYGTGVFEGIRCFKTPKGPAIFRLREHVTRMIESAEIYLMKMPYSPEEIMNSVKTTVSANKLEECYIRPLAYYGYGEMGLNPLPNKVHLGVAAWRWESYLGEKAEREGVRCQVSSWRRVHPSGMPPQAKSTANYANGGLAKIEALKAGYDEAILLNMEAMVAEASAENIFRVKDGILSTPPASAGVLRGVTRDTIIRFAADMGIEFRRSDISREELYTSDELFLTGTAAGVTPVREVDGRKIGSGHWPLTERFSKAYTETVHGRYEKYAKWLTMIGKPITPQIEAHTRRSSNYRP